MPEEANPLPTLPLFPIQLRKYDIGEVNYSCLGFADPGVQPATKFQLNVAVSEFMEESRTIQVTLTFSCASEPPESPIAYPYSLKLALHGEFHVSEEVSRLNMDKDQIKQWGSKNGVLVLLPFLREAVYTFTQKTGFKPMMIPLVETKAFSVMPPAAKIKPAALPVPAARV